ncbi:MAG TPA: ABC transporter ATP-binding protein, partial [Armatimonadetes bacterium]|nr:ABC transporter ATP-binding protein [Armatimonadota bacterium]
MGGMSQPLLEIDGASVMRGGALAAGGTLALDNLSFVVRSGEHVALLGPNGSGKTTLIGLLTRREWPLRRADGRPPVRLLGRELGDVFELRRQMGIISPDDDRGFIAERCTALEAVLSGFFAARGIWRRQVSAEQEAAARAALERLGVADLAARRTDAMRTGQLRRGLIARALVHQPPLLLLDEPTNHL